MNELGKVLARLSGEPIEQVIWLQDPGPKGPEETRWHISMCMGALKREKSLLNGLLGAGFDLHPILAQLFLKKAQDHVEGSSQENEVEPLLVPPVEALVIDQPAAVSWKFVCSLTERERELLVAFIDETHDVPTAAKKLGIKSGTVYVMIQRLREKWRSILVKGGSKP
jgi:hypothetical protein